MALPEAAEKGHPDLVRIFDSPCQAPLLAQRCYMLRLFVASGGFDLHGTIRIPIKLH